MKSKINKKEIVTRYKSLHNKMIKTELECKKEMAKCIKALLIEGYSFREIAGLFNKNSKQSIFQLYRSYIKTK